MLYLIKSYKPLGKSILKIGFTDNLQERLNHYFYTSPGVETISVRPGDEILESLLHFYLKSIGGLQYKKNGCLEEWYINSPEVYRIFHVSQENLERKIWKNRGRMFKGSRFIPGTIDYKLFQHLYLKYKDEYPFEGEEFVIQGDTVIKTKAKGVDISFWRSYKGKNVRNFEEIKNPVARDFLDNHFYETGIFRDKLKMYCEFCDTYRGETEILDILNHRIENPRFFQFYNYFGTKGCSAKGYEEKRLLGVLGDDSKEEVLTKEICLRFKPGDRYTMKEIKEFLRDIYSSLGITKTPKATDLGKYFKLIKTSITLPDKNIVSGFKLDTL